MQKGGILFKGIDFRLAPGCFGRVIAPQTHGGKKGSHLDSGDWMMRFVLQGIEDGIQYGLRQWIAGFVAQRTRLRGTCTHTGLGFKDKGVGIE